MALGTHRPARAARSRWLRLGMMLLAVLISVGAGMPAYARLIAGPQAHACHCETRGGHAHCACPVCFQELSASHDDDGPATSTVKGSCGDDDPGWKTLSDPAVPPASLVAVAPAVAHVTPLVTSDTPQLWLAPLEPRPPRVLGVRA